MKDKTLDSLILAKPKVWPDLIPASISLAGAEPELTLLWDSASVFRDKLNTIRENYDFILLDCPPSLTLLTVNAVSYTHLDVYKRQLLERSKDGCFRRG